VNSETIHLIVIYFMVIGSLQIFRKFAICAHNLTINENNDIFVVYQMQNNGKYF
jgi:hypothetical protein